MMFRDSVGLSDGAGRGADGGELSEGVATVSDNSAPDKLQNIKRVQFSIYIQGKNIGNKITSNKGSLRKKKKKSL